MTAIAEKADGLTQMRALAAGKVPTEVQLELINAASRRQSTEIKALLAEREARLAAGAAAMPATDVSSRAARQAREEFGLS